jgi:hypothetical protein
VKWSIHDNPHGSFVDNGDAKVIMLSVPTSISIIHDDIIIGAAAIGR